MVPIPVRETVAYGTIDGTTLTEAPGSPVRELREDGEHEHADRVKLLGARDSPDVLRGPASTTAARSPEMAPIAAE